MGNNEFEKLCKDLVARHYMGNSPFARTHPVEPKDVYIVWCCKVLQNNKALASTPVHDGVYYEITHNGDKAELYLDVYKKQENQLHRVEDVLNIEPR